MRIFRSPRRFDVVTVARIAGLDTRLSLDARGLLFYVLVQEDGWNGKAADIGKENGCGRDKMTRLLRELREAGYATLVRNDAAGRGKPASSSYEFQDRPALETGDIFSDTTR